MVHARIFRPAKGATQSGTARTKRWVMAFEQTTARQVEPVMGWTASSDMAQEVQLSFSSKDEALAYAQSCGIAYVVDDPQVRRVRPKNYADNFRYDRVAARSTGTDSSATAIVRGEYPEE